MLRGLEKDLGNQKKYVLNLKKNILLFVKFCMYSLLV